MTSPIPRIEKLNLYRDIKRSIPRLPLDGLTKSLVAHHVNTQARRGLPERRRLKRQYDLMKQGKSLSKEMHKIISVADHTSTYKLLSLVYLDNVPKKKTLPGFVLDFIRDKKDVEKYRKLFDIRHVIARLPSSQEDVKKNYYEYLDRQQLKGRKLDSFSFSKILGFASNESIELPEPIREDPMETPEKDFDYEEKQLRNIKRFHDRTTRYRNLVYEHGATIPSLKIEMGVTPFGLPRPVKVQTNSLARRAQSVKCGFLKLRPLTRGHFEYLEGLKSKHAFEQAVSVKGSDRLDNSKILNKMSRNLRVFMRNKYFIDENGEYHFSENSKDCMSEELLGLYSKAGELA
ncbi:unnamed protein product [Kuraishia capsulata CBS 1993]|uniref:Genetic interactor of prohibitin 5, mitochondrial n=1 Tax=Kuraishia capsulata CBS 1993 TaxID=1382522 RepID=W6MGQ9_9ASCO|nr:uncharacterized protein KUCA_T00001328001 [Kuraishia capsulata CBS 1993]CDK25359.1 unnamed protein product [Kuraishia capsulata CBS 1993]